MKTEEMLKLMKILASPVRLEIIVLMKKAGGFMGLATIKNQLAPSRQISTSHICEQLNILEAAGLVRKRQIGRFVWYVLSQERVQENVTLIRMLMAETERGRRTSKRRAK